MQYEYRGRNLNDVLRRSISQVQCKSGNRSDCDRISRLRTNHANNIEVILEEISDAVEEINRRAEELGKDFRDAALSTALDITILFTAGTALLRALRNASRIDYRLGVAGAGYGAITHLKNNLSEYEQRLQAYRKWRTISSLSNSISIQRMDLYRSISALSKLSSEWQKLGCGQRDPYDPRNG